MVREAMNRPTIISFATDDRLYRDHLEGMLATARKWGLNYRTEILDSSGQWRSNMQKKPGWIWKHREAEGGLLMWADADARIRKDPVVPEGQWDVGVFRRDGRHPRTGTVLLWDTEGCRELLGRWAFLQERMGRANDQVTMERAIEEMGSGLRLLDLPREWCALRGRRGGWMHGVRDEDVVVGHEQASRVARRGLGA